MYHHLVSARLLDLRPTQVTAGYVEVEEKCREWASLKKKERRALLDSHVFPCVIGPKARYYIVDHHHLGLALLKEGVQRTRLTVLENFAWLTPEIFWRVMEFRRWTHPYDASGKRVAYSEMAQTAERAARRSLPKSRRNRAQQGRIRECMTGNKVPPYTDIRAARNQSFKMARADTKWVGCALQ